METQCQGGAEAFYLHRNPKQFICLINQIQQVPIAIHQAMALPSGLSTALSNPIGIRLVLLALVVMPVAVLVLPFNVDGHRINPTTPDPILPMPLLSSGKNWQQPQRQVPVIWTPAVPMPLLHQALLILKRSRCLNISAFCREPIAEKLERLEALK